MGVPVLTLPGRSFAARVCGSLVRAAGLPELVCADPADYVTRAVELGRQPERLAELKKRLIAGRDTCLLFDTPLLVRHLEDLYCGMWTDFQASRSRICATSTSTERSGWSRISRPLNCSMIMPIASFIVTGSRIGTASIRCFLTLGCGPRDYRRWVGYPNSVHLTILIASVMLM